ncbi:MAG: glycosyltransferase family protein [Melioribacteraceae bacterium]
MKTVAIIQARFGSTRLPGKILKELSGKPILWHMVDRLSRCKMIDRIVIATTTLSEDDRVEEFCKKNNFSFYRGSSEDVLSRYYESAKLFEAGTVIRITSDCPVIDPDIIDSMMNKYFSENKSGKIDYLSNVMKRTFPRGLDTEIFSFETLAKAHETARLQYEREHVTPYIYNHPDKFFTENFENEKDLSFHRWTVDTPEDFRLMEEIYSALYDEKRIFLFEDILGLFEKKPGLIEINQNIKQKNLGE